MSDRFVQVATVLTDGAVNEDGGNTKFASYICRSQNACVPFNANQVEFATFDTNSGGGVDVAFFIFVY